MSSRNRASLTAIIGASGTGKSLWIKQTIAKSKPRRLMVWDTMAEYGDLGPQERTLAPLLRGLRNATWCSVFVPDADAKRRAAQFNLWCAAGFEAGNCTLIVEELSNVTRAGWSPPGWMRVVTQGRHRGLSVIGTTQRPQLVDKTFLDNATTIRVGRLNTAAGRRTMADMLDLPVENLAALENLAWLSRDTTTGTNRRDQLKIPRRAT